MPGSPVSPHSDRSWPYGDSEARFGGDVAAMPNAPRTAQRWPFHQTLCTLLAPSAGFRRSRRLGQGTLDYAGFRNVPARPGHDTPQRAFRQPDRGRLLPSRKWPRSSFRSHCEDMRLWFGRLWFGRLSFGRLSFGRLSFGRLSFGQAQRRNGRSIRAGSGMRVRMTVATTAPGFPPSRHTAAR